MSDRKTVSVTIANGAAVSGEVNVGPFRIVGIQMPAGWTAANLTLQALIDQPAGNPPAPVFGDVVDGAGAELVLAAAPAAAKYVALADTLALNGLGRIKVRSGTTGLPVNQAAARTIILVLV